MGGNGGYAYTTADEIRTLQSWLDAKKIKVLRRYYETALTRRHWGSIDRERILSFLETNLAGPQP